MVGDFLFALIYIYVVWSVGQVIIFAMKPTRQNEGIEWLAFAIGFSFLTVLTTFLYFTCRLPVEVIRGIWGIFGGLSTALLIWKRQIHLINIKVPAMVLGLYLFLLIPGILGKDQYYVYRGNCTDQQTYMEETVALSSHGISWYESRTMEEIAIESDVLLRGYDWAIKDRPSAGLMIAVLCRTGKGEVYWVEYLYRMFVQAMIAASLIYLFRVLAGEDGIEKKWHRVIVGIAAVFYCIGFWGQIQYDIDAVSQMSSIAVLAALTAVFLRCLLNILKDEPFEKSEYFLLILLASGGLMLYLESAVVHGALYLVTGIVMVLWERRRLKLREVLQLTGIPLSALLILIIANYRILGFFLTQIETSVSEGRQDWASYFNAWWLGKHGTAAEGFLQPVSRLVNFVVALFGMYNITVDYETFGGKKALLLTGLVGVTAILMVFCLLRFLIKKEKALIRAFWALTLTGIVVVLGMVAIQKYWSAGKLLYYVSPYLYAFFCIPLLRKLPRREWMERVALCGAVLMLVANGKMVLERAYDMKVNYACSGYRGNYPSDMIGGLKPMAKFNFDTKELEGADGVCIEDLSVLSDHQFYLQYLKVKLTHAHIPYQVENDINYYREPLDISKKRALMGTIKVIGVVQGNDGRYQAEIRD